MKIFLAILALTCSLGSAAFADGDVCFVGEGSVDTSQNTASEGSNMAPLVVRAYVASAPQCKSLQPYLATLSATEFTFYIVSAGMACTGVGATASVVVFGAGAALQALDFVVRNLPCEPDLPEAAIEKKVEDKVCETLMENGISCRKKK